MKKLIAVMVVLALAAGGYFAWRIYGSGVGGDDSVLGGSGTIEAEQIAITPQTAGRVISAPAHEGALVKKGAVLYKVDDALLRLQVEQAKAAVTAAQSNHANVKNDDDSSSADIAAAKAQLDQAKVALEMAQVQQGYATITSPIDGVLSSISVKSGENAVPGSTLAVVSDIANLTVTIYIPEDRIGEVDLGRSGKLTTDSTDREYAAEVVFVASEAEFTPASVETKDQRVKLVYQVKLALKDADTALKPGMPADVVLGD